MNKHTHTHTVLSRFMHSQVFMHWGRLSKLDLRGMISSFLCFLMRFSRVLLSSFSVAHSSLVIRRLVRTRNNEADAPSIVYHNYISEIMISFECYLLCARVACHAHVWLVCDWWRNTCQKGERGKKESDTKGKENERRFKAGKCVRVWLGRRKMKTLTSLSFCAKWRCVCVCHSEIIMFGCLLLLSCRSLFHAFFCFCTHTHP